MKMLEETRMFQSFLDLEMDEVQLQNFKTRLENDPTFHRRFSEYSSISKAMDTHVLKDVQDEELEFASALNNYAKNKPQKTEKRSYTKVLIGMLGLLIIAALCFLIPKDKVTVNEPNYEKIVNDELKNIINLDRLSNEVLSIENPDHLDELNKNIVSKFELGQYKDCLLLLNSFGKENFKEDHQILEIVCKLKEDKFNNQDYRTLESIYESSSSFKDVAVWVQIAYLLKDSEANKVLLLDKLDIVKNKSYPRSKLAAEVKDYISM